MKYVFLLILYGSGAFFFGYSSNRVIEILSIVAIAVGGIMVAKFIDRHSK